MWHKETEVWHTISTYLLQSDPQKFMHAWKYSTSVIYSGCPCLSPSPGLILALSCSSCESPTITRIYQCSFYKIYYWDKVLRRKIGYFIIFTVKNLTPETFFTSENTYCSKKQKRKDKITVIFQWHITTLVEGCALQAPNTFKTRLLYFGYKCCSNNEHTLHGASPRCYYGKQ